MSELRTISWKSELRTPNSQIPLLVFILFRFTVDADPSPWHRFEPRGSDFIFAIHADAVGALLDAMDRVFDRTKEFVIRLFERKPDVEIIFLAGLVDPVTAL